MNPALHAHPAFAPYARWLSRFEGGRIPDAATFTAWACERDLRDARGRPIAFEASDSRRAALDYEASIAARAIVPLRPGDWHDAFNALAWLALPQTKLALNAIHVRDASATTPNRRSRARDAATLLDESGLVFACDDRSLPSLLRAHAWRALFVEREHDVATRVRVVVTGHGLLDRLRKPYPALTAKALVVCFAPDALPAPDDLAALDSAAAACVASSSFDPAALTPLPVSALPGWDVEQRGPARFDDATVFRPRPDRHSGAVRAS